MFPPDGGREMSGPGLEAGKTDGILKARIAAHEYRSNSDGVSSDLSVEWSERLSDALLSSTEGSIGGSFSPAPGKDLQTCEKGAESIGTAVA